MADVNPTRSELIALKKRIALAKAGHKLLKKKRDGLIQEFFEVLKGAKTARRDLHQAYMHARKKGDIMRALQSDIELEMLSLAIQPAPDISLGTKNIMGTVVPTITSDDMQKELSGRGYGLLTTSNAVNETCAAYERLIEQILVVAEVETATRRLIEEIGKTKRRVNALEYELIPRMVRTKDRIILRLDEIERENTYRIKMVKRKLQQGKG